MVWLKLVNIKTISKSSHVFHVILIIFILMVLFLLTTPFDFESKTTLTKLQNNTNTNRLPLPKIILQRIKFIIQCVDTTFGYSIRQQKGYVIVYNYLPAVFKFKCHESVTLATHGEFYYLENLVLLAERWKGPISVAVYAPGHDFVYVMEAIFYLRRCTTEFVQNYVSFHVYFPRDLMPEIQIPSPETLLQDFNCSKPPIFREKGLQDTFRFANKLPYPINVARNIARESARTYFVLSSDIELYPSLNVIPSFLWMIAKTESILRNNNPMAFTLPVFNVASNATIPNTKAELVEKIKNGTAKGFQKDVCSYCENITWEKKWINSHISVELGVLTVAKRTRCWEPVYISTKSEPLYEEQLFWEGRMDKMMHAYKLCLLNYDYLILDNLFLVHKPGIRPKHSPNAVGTLTQNASLINKILGQMRLFYIRGRWCSFYEVSTSEWAECVRVPDFNFIF